LSDDLRLREDSLLSSCLGERPQNRIHEVRIVSNVLNVVALGHRFDTFENNSRSAAPAVWK
jgi:hypothetical protein